MTHPFYKHLLYGKTVPKIGNKSAPTAKTKNILITHSHQKVHGIREGPVIAY